MNCYVKLKSNDEIINDIKEQKKLQEFYISSEILETLKKIIMENNEKCFIDFRVKNKILDYLSFFRDTNKMLEKENKKEKIENIIKKELLSFLNNYFSKGTILYELKKFIKFKQVL